MCSPGLQDQFKPTVLTGGLIPPNPFKGFTTSNNGDNISSTGPATGTQGETPADTDGMRRALATLRKGMNTKGTLLTGPQGVPGGDLNLGKTQLLGS